MIQEDFDSLAAQGYNRIPVCRQILADIDTAMGAYLKVAQGPGSYLFESVQSGRAWGRYSMIGLPCRTTLRVRGNTVTVTVDGAVTETTQAEDPLAWLEGYMGRFRVPQLDDLPRFTGGLVGYFGYDTVRYVEPRLAGHQVADPLALPDIMLMLSDEVLVFDNLLGRLHVVVHADPGQPNAWHKAQDRLETLVQALRQPRIPEPHRPAQASHHAADVTAGFSRPAFEAAVRRIQHYIHEGDVMQVVLSQRMSKPLHAEPVDLYRALRSLNPSPHMFYMDMGEFHIVGSSPEILVRLEDQQVTVRPIAGTRPRGRSADEDVALEEELCADPKERAEHLMLMDLGRNDVGRISEIGSVKLTERMVVERYSHVMHLVSNVVGRVKPESSRMDVLRATFPAGTVSGAPKVRAMQIIDELEPVKRGVYAGAVGYLSWSGEIETAIAIRTAVIKEGQVHVQAGAGIVADSVPSLEWEETINKGRAMFKAVAIAEAGLHDSRQPAEVH